MNIFKAIGKGIKRFFLALIYCILVVFLRMFMRCKPSNKKMLRKTDQARVIVSNHLEFFGPMVMWFYLPVKKKTFWMNARLMDEKTAEEEMSHAVMEPKNFKWAPKWLRKLAIKILKTLEVYILRDRIKGIPVNRGDTRDMVKTFKTSVDALEKGKSIAICPEVIFEDVGIGKLYPGFAALGKYYYKKTGKIISFYPLYIDKKGKKMTFGEPVDYDPNNPNFVDEIVTHSYIVINKIAGTYKEGESPYLEENEEQQNEEQLTKSQEKSETNNE